MPIAKGDRIPSANVIRMTDSGPESIDIADYVAGKRVALFGLPGAYTSTCTMAHLPSFIRTFEDFMEKGVDEVICVAVNDIQVMTHWGGTTGATETGITMLADWNSEFAKAIGLNFTAPPVGFIDRIARCAMVVSDGTVDVIQIEEGRGVCEMTAGETLLEMV